MPSKREENSTVVHRPSLGTLKMRNGCISMEGAHSLRKRDALLAPCPSCRRIYFETLKRLLLTCIINTVEEMQTCY